MKTLISILIMSSIAIHANAQKAQTTNKATHEAAPNPDKVNEEPEMGHVKPDGNSQKKENNRVTPKSNESTHNTNESTHPTNEKIETEPHHTTPTNSDVGKAKGGDIRINSASRAKLYGTPEKKTALPPENKSK